MNQRFQNEDISRVSKEQENNELYKAICTIGAQLESELAEFGLCPEECFEETLEMLTMLADKGEDAMPELDTMWHRKFNEYRRFDRQVGEDELRKVVGIVFGFVIFAIDSSRHNFYRYKLTEALTYTIASHQFTGWTVTLDKIFSLPLSDGWFDRVMLEELNETVETDTEKWQKLKTELNAVFYTDEASQKELDRFVTFLQKTPKPTDITAEVRRLTHITRAISNQEYKTNLHKILHDAGIYNRQFETWRQQVD